MNDAGDGDDKKTNNDGSNSDVKRILAQPSGPIVVTMIIAVPGHDREN